MLKRGAGRSLGLLVLIAAGCSLGPRQFRDVNDPAPLVRARAAGLSEERPRAEYVPELIHRLSDPDAVVRLSAHEELRRRTGQDFGYRPWDDVTEREAAINQWRGWWESQLVQNPVPAPATGGSDSVPPSSSERGTTGGGPSL